MKKVISEHVSSMVRFVRPRVVSRVRVRVMSDRDMSEYSDATNDGYLFVVNDIVLNEQDHMKVYPLSSEYFVAHGEFCEVCDQRMHTLFRVVGRDGSVGLVKSVCPSCTYIRFTRLPNEEWYTNFFTKDFYSGEVERRGVPNTDTTIYDAAKKYVSADLPVFDVGCGFGEKLKPFVDCGFSAVGVEPSKHRADIARTMLGDNIYRSTAENAIHSGAEKQAPFGLCSFYHVLEFCLDPYTLLKDLYSLMADDAVLYIATGLFHTRNIMHESHFALIRSTYNPYSLRRLLHHIGFEILDMGIIDKGTTMQVVARKRSVDGEGVVDDAQKKLQMDIVRRHIRSELGFACSSPMYEVSTEWLRRTRRAVLTRVPSNNNNVTSIGFVHDSDDPVMLVK